MKNRPQEPLVRVTWLRESTTVAEALPSLGSALGRLKSRVTGKKDTDFTPENITRWLVQKPLPNGMPDEDAIRNSIWARLERNPTADEVRAISEIWNEAVRQKTITYVERSGTEVATSTVQAGWITWPSNDSDASIYDVRLYVLVRHKPDRHSGNQYDIKYALGNTPVPYYSSKKRETSPGGKELGYVMELLKTHAGTNVKFSEPLGPDDEYPGYQPRW